jgi:hypothetical protein
VRTAANTTRLPTSTTGWRRLKSGSGWPENKRITGRGTLETAVRFLDEQRFIEAGLYEGEIALNQEGVLERHVEGWWKE